MVCANVTLILEPIENGVLLHLVVTPMGGRGSGGGRGREGAEGGEANRLSTHGQTPVHN